MHAELGDDTYLSRPVEDAFPGTMVDKFSDAVTSHPLKKEIIASLYHPGEFPKKFL